MRPYVALVLLVALAACGGITGPLGPLTDGGSSGAPDGQPSGAITELEDGELQDHGCGHGFTVGTPDGAVRLSLWSGADVGDAVDPGTHQLGGAWTGELVVGTDLFAQWCDDVIAPDEPEVVQEASWEVTGTLDWQLVEGDGQCPSVATATLTDASVAADGEPPVDLPRVELRNELFGCVAG